MTLKRLVLCTVSLLLVLSMAGTVQAKKYSVAAGSAGQLHIGGGLALPIQPAATILVTGMNFPPLLIPRRPNKHAHQTTVMAIQKRLTVPPRALERFPVQQTIGLFTSNPTLYGVATDLGFVWPTKAGAVFSTGARTGLKTTSFVTPMGNNITYSNPLASKFGGPARFEIYGGDADATDKIPGAAVTIYAIAIPGPGPAGGNPPCSHTAFAGAFGLPPTPACVAALAAAVPTGLAAVGGPLNTLATNGTLVVTPGGLGGLPPVPGIGIGAFGPPPPPPGSIVFFTFTPAMTMAGFTNMATSFGYPFTTGRITLSAPFAKGAPEAFIISGSDMRTSGGFGAIQLVAGALSQRTLSGPNANRGWIRLVLGPVGDHLVPAMSPFARGTAAGLIVVLALGYVARRRFFGRA